MELDQYQLMYCQERAHWWYAGMRCISEKLLERFPPRSSAGDAQQWEILDAGCGTGGMTKVLGSRGRVTGIDFSSEALRLAKLRRLPGLVRASVGELPFEAGRFDLVTCFDVLYHLNVDDDVAALSELRRVLRPGGVLHVRLPAYDWIRGAHDAAVHTRHRYSRRELREKLASAGFEVAHTSYANSLLFPLAPAKRLLERGNGVGRVADLWQPPRSLNRMLADLLAAEAPVITSVGLPWGLSIHAVAHRPFLDSP
jgi:SAM-dependent methyltransferase